MFKSTQLLHSWIIPIWIFMMPVTLLAQIDNGGYQSMRSLAMGGTGTAGEGVESLFENQAAAAFTDIASVSAGAWQRFTLAEYTQVGAIGHINLDNGALGIEVNQDGDELYSAQKFGLYYSRALSSRISLAAQLNYVQLSLDEHGQSGTVNVELASLVKLIPQFHIGIHIYNPIPQQLGNTIDLPTIFTVGTRYIHSDQLSFNADFLKSIDGHEDIRIGGEYHPTDILWLRAGVQTFPSIICFGFGIQISESIMVDSAISWSAALGVSPGLQLRYDWQ